MKKFIYAIKRFHRNERGSAMTEFTITIPAWIFIFYGILDMGFSPMVTTEVQAQASLAMWQESIKLTTPIDLFNNPSSAGDQAPYLSPASGAIKAGVAEGKGRNGHNGRGSLTTAEGVIHAASISGLGGSQSSFGIGDAHFAESTYRGDLLSLGMSGKPTFKTKAKDVIGDSKYGDLVLNDSITDGFNNFDSSGGFTSKIAGAVLTALDAAGAMHSVGAGIRYGAVHGNKKGSYDIILGSTIEPEYNYDNLVSPVPLQGDSANIVPMLLSRVSAETEENYAVALRFGKAEWGGSRGQTFEAPSEADGKESGENSDEAKDAEKCEGGGFENQAQCDLCEGDSCNSSTCPGYDLCTCSPNDPACQPANNNN